MTDKTLEILEAVREASISVACLLDDTDGTVYFTDYLNDIEHIQEQVAILEDYLGTKYHDFKTDNILVNTWLQNYRRETNG